MEEIMPYEINFRYNLVKVNNTYNSYWYVRNYNSDLKMLNNITALAYEPGIGISIHCKKLDNVKFLKEISEKLSLANSEKSSLKGEQIDIDLINKSSEEARMLRYIVQVEGENLYESSVIISIAANSLEELFQKENLAKNRACSLGTTILPLNFNQKEGYLLSLPLNFESLPVQKRINKIFTTSSLAYMFPFYTSVFCQMDGIYIGEYKNTSCYINFRNKTSNNFNAIILGSSGAGKSFFVKLTILQYLYRGVKQVIIDPEGEYVKIANLLGERVINKDNFNPLEIQELFARANPQNFMDMQLNKVARILELDEIFESNEKKNEVLEKIIEIYSESGINHDISSLYKLSDDKSVYSKKRYLANKEFPNILELKEKLANIKMSKQERQSLIKNIEYFKSQDDVFDEEQLIVFDLTTKDSKFVSCIIEMLEEYSFGNTLIYIDEMWQLMSKDKEKVSRKITELFKTIRKRGSGIIGITQDISDILTYDNGNFGKSIINNSFIKIYFKMEYLDVDVLQKLGIGKEEDYLKIRQLSRGHAMIDYGSNIFDVEVVAQEFNKKIIEGGYS